MRDWKLHGRPNKCYFGGTRFDSAGVSRKARNGKERGDCDDDQMDDDEDYDSDDQAGDDNDNDYDDGN